MRIETERCALRPWDEGDVAVLPLIADDAIVARYMPLKFPHRYTESDARAWVTSNGSDQATNVAITVEGVLAGGMGLRLGSDIYRGSAEVGYWLGRAFWGQGIATAALRAFTEHAFMTFPLHRLWAAVMEFNTPSLRVLEKSGYNREAILRSALTDRADQIQDCALYAMLRPPAKRLV